MGTRSPAIPPRAEPLERSAPVRARVPPPTGELGARGEEKKIQKVNNNNKSHREVLRARLGYGTVGFAMRSRVVGSHGSCVKLCVPRNVRRDFFVRVAARDLARLCGCTPVDLRLLLLLLMVAADGKA